jgi:iron-sulfur cluster assembly accessory protein
MSFLEENANKEGVTTTESGLQYKVLTSGEGNTPRKTDTVLVHYEGKLTDGTVFDSSIERDEPVEFPVNGVIAGWTEALQLMKEGDVWELYIPSGLAYGKAGAGEKIGPDETLIFETRLLSIKTFAPLQIEDRAVVEIKRVLEEQEMPIETHALRVGVSGGGCSGFQYALNFVKEDEINEESDVEIEVQGLRVVVDHRSQPYLAGTEIGFQDGLQGRGFVFNNPMATGGCGCGTSFSTAAAQGGSCGSGGCGTGCG